VPKIPGVPHLQAVRALEKAGFKIVREGKHIVMSDGRRILTIPRHNPVNAYTMGRYCSGRRSYRGGVQEASLREVRAVEQGISGLPRQEGDVRS
jgi:hypothetical protein